MCTNREIAVIDSGIEDIIKRAQQKFQERLTILRLWKSSLRNLPSLPPNPWIEKKLTTRLPLPRVSEYSTIAAVDGGILGEELRGFDVLIARAIVVTYTGVGKQVQVDYFPSFDPQSEVIIKESFESRTDFSQYSTLLRLKHEYSVSLEKLEIDPPDVLFIDGSVAPLFSDLSLNSDFPDLVQMLEMVKNTYRKLVRMAEEKGTVLLGIVKDSRSRELTRHLTSSVRKWKDFHSPGSIDDLTDTELMNGLLEEGERSSWFRSKIPLSLKSSSSIWVCYARPILSDDPVRLEVITFPWKDFSNRLDSALQVFYILCQHGLPIALPTNLQEADRQVKLKRRVSEEFVEELSLYFGIPVERLRKRRTFDSSFLHFT